ncbi:hypothetical protein ID1017_07230 [Helicobacter pylori]
MRNSLNTMHSSCSCSAKEHRVLEKMHAIILKGVDNLTERLGDDSRVNFPTEYISRLYGAGDMKLDELCLLFAKCLNIPVRNPETTKTKGKRKRAIIFFSYRYDKSLLKGVKTPKQTQISKDNNLFECCGLWLIFASSHLYH